MKIPPKSVERGPESVEQAPESVEREPPESVEQAQMDLNTADDQFILLKKAFDDTGISTAAQGTAEALGGVKPHDVFRIQIPLYGLRSAVISWYQSLKDTLFGLGYRCQESSPCIFTITVENSKNVF